MLPRFPITQTILERLKGVTETSNGWSARCPAHDDSNPSLSITELDDKVLVHDHAGCSKDKIMGAIKLEVKDLFTKTSDRPEKAKEVCAYDYCDENGSVLFQKIRYEPKDFRLRKPDSEHPGKMKWSIDGVRRVLYRLPNLIQGINTGKPVFVVEGEKDADCLAKLGLTATTNFEGANKKGSGRSSGKWLPIYSDTLAGATVIVIADRDTPGRDHAADIAAKLQGKAVSIKVIELPDVKGKTVKDGSDYFAAGGDIGEFQDLVDKAPEWKPTEEPCAETEAVVERQLPNILTASAPVVATASENETELEFARRLTAALPPVKTVGKVWHIYRNGAWLPFNSDLVKPQALAILPEKIRTIRRASTMIEHVEAERQTDLEGFKGFHAFDGSAVLLNARNGIVRVTPDRIELLPHSPEHCFTRQTAAQFNPDATAALFGRVLNEVLPDQEDRELFQLCTGNFLFPDCRHEVAVCCYGEAGRGKSTVADPVATALGRDLVSRLSMSQVCDPRSYHLPGLKFAAVNLGTELTTADIAESGNFKTLVSGEPIEARPIYGAPFVMQTACKLWFLANSLPRFKHGTEAELRRTRFLRFDYHPPIKDVTLKARLAAEMDGVFLYMVQGLQRLLTCSAIPIGGRESRAVHDRFRVSNDPVGAFVQCRCILDREAREVKEDLRKAFVEFAEQHELAPACGEWFFRVLLERFPSLKDARLRIGGERVRRVQGISLRSSLTIESSE